MTATLLPLNCVDRAYRPHDEIQDYASSDFITRRRLTQHELLLRWELYTKVTDAAEPAWRQLVSDLTAMDRFAGYALGLHSDHRTAEQRESDALKAKEASLRIRNVDDAITPLRYDQVEDGVLIGLLAGQRMGLRLGMGLAARMMMGKGSESPLPGLPANAAQTLIAGAQVDDSLADRLIGWLLTGHEPEMVAAAKEGGAAK